LKWVLPMPFDLGSAPHWDWTAHRSTGRRKIKATSLREAGVGPDKPGLARTLILLLLGARWIAIKSQ
jgi:hypothetical protein